MKYLSICSGIEAATVAWHHMGWSPVGFAEIEKFPAQLLAHHYPDTPNFGDLTKHESWNIESGTVDLLVGGTPCQAFSVAGLRRGMDDERGQLTLEFVRLAARLRPRWIVWENVPGVLSSAGGRDFGSFLGALGELGYGWAYRILDAQYFGVAQRRRRVFVVGYLGDWRNAAAVLFERESMRRDSPPRREARQEVAGSIGSRASSGGGFSTDFECSGGLQVVGALDCRIGAQRAQNAANGHLLPVVGTDCYNGQITGDVAATMGTCGSSVNGSGPTVMQLAKCITRGEGYRYDFETTTLLPMATFAKTHKPTSNTDSEGWSPVDVAPTVTHWPRDHSDAGTNTACVHGVAMAFHENQRAEVTLNDTAGSLKVAGGKPGQGYPAVLAPTLTATNDPSRSPQSSEITAQVAAVTATTMQVRRLTPVECERLQGFPDGYTDIRPRGKDTPDGPRYKALGNSMAVPVMRWIGERIEAVDKLSR